LAERNPPRFFGRKELRTRLRNSNNAQVRAFQQARGCANKP
jgi:hypothetical protein